MEEQRQAEETEEQEPDALPVQEKQKVASSEDLRSNSTSMSRWLIEAREQRSRTSSLRSVTWSGKKLKLSSDAEGQERGAFGGRRVKSEEFNNDYHTSSAYALSPVPEGSRIERRRDESALITS